jgi:hypothetical protein
VREVEEEQQSKRKRGREMGGVAADKGKERKRSVRGVAL